MKVNATKRSKTGEPANGTRGQQSLPLLAQRAQLGVDESEQQQLLLTACDTCGVTKAIPAIRRIAMKRVNILEG